RAHYEQWAADRVDGPRLGVQLCVEARELAGREIELRQPLTRDAVDRVEFPGRVQVPAVRAVCESPDRAVEGRGERRHQVRALVVRVEAGPVVVRARELLEHLGELPSDIDRVADLGRGMGIAVTRPVDLD